MDQAKVLNVAIVGGGPGCKAIMDMIFAEKLRDLRMKLIGVACTNPGAVGYCYAQEKGIYTTKDYRDLYKLKNFNMIIELTGRDEVANKISRTRPEHVRLMDHIGARVFWDVFHIEEERLAERKRAEEELRDTVNRLRIAYEQSITYARELNQEIGERERAEKALAAERERLHVTLRSIGDGVITTDTEGRIVLVNKVAEELIGWTQEEAVGRPLTEVFCIIDEKTRQPCKNPVQEVIEIGGIVGLANHTVLIARDGTERILSDSGSPIRDMDGNVIGVVLVFRDVTERRKLEAKFQQAHKMEAIGTLAGGTAHDFNNLLMGIQGATSLMLMNIDSEHSHFEHLHGIEDMVRKGADLTKQLLGFARGGKYEVKLTDLNVLIKESSQMFGRTRKEIKIHRKYQKDLWRVEVDRGQIEQVLLNLYVNAWQAMPGGEDLYIETSNDVLDENYIKPFTVEPGNYVRVSVTDTGTGMDEETQQRIFEPFFTTKEMGRGTGLGLASAYGIIKSHGGIINVYSEKGKGSTFNIYLPAISAKSKKEKNATHLIL